MARLLFFVLFVVILAFAAWIFWLMHKAKMRELESKGAK
jgi:Tfp pilus assembly protein PilO